MPPPNQTTPDSPERVRGETPRTDEQEFVAQDMTNGAEVWVVTRKFARELESETTRLAEALKECCAAWFGSTDLEAVSRAMQKAQHVLNTQPAPISGAKKE